MIICDYRIIIDYIPNNDTLDRCLEQSFGKKLLISQIPGIVRSTKQYRNKS